MTASELINGGALIVLFSVIGALWRALLTGQLVLGRTHDLVQKQLDAATEKYERLTAESAAEGKEERDRLLSTIDRLTRREETSSSPAKGSS